jgi:hypothetical protein
MDVRCFRCRRTPDVLPEYWPEQTGEDIEPLDYVLAEEATLNMENGHFCCTECYVIIGMPTAPEGWKAP